MRLILADLEHPERARMEACVRDVYRDVYGARITSFLPTLLGAVGGRDRVFGVIGTGAATSAGPLLVESYLDRPLEVVLSEAVGDSIPRAAVAEVGNLAARRPGVGRALVFGLARVLQEQGLDWVVFAGTSSLVDRFRRSGDEPIDLAEADGARLGPARIEWGSYYATAPRVTAVRLDVLLRTNEVAA